MTRPRPPQPLTVHQFHYSAAPHDAIYNQMAFLQSALADVGIGGHLFASEIKPGLANQVHPLAKALWDCDLLLVHHSHGNPSLKEVLKVEVPKALVYHNITPAAWSRHDPYIADLSRTGRNQLGLFPGHVVASFADSKFNAKELLPFGLSAQILPLFELSSTKPSVKTRPGKDLLFVGRMVPHKNQAAIIRTFAYYARLEPASQLTLVGGQDPLYGEYLRLLIASLGLESRARVLGKVSDDELTRLYREAGAFLCLSEHEGFCIPLIEAMKHGVPVFAFPQAAIAETLGGAGVELVARDPRDIACILAATLEDRVSLEAILRGQAERLRELSKLQNRKTVQILLGGLLTELRKPPSQRSGGHHSSKTTARSSHRL